VALGHWAVLELEHLRLLGGAFAIGQRLFRWGLPMTTGTAQAVRLGLGLGHAVQGLPSRVQRAPGGPFSLPFKTA
jgi:hypothetical protein